MALFSKSSDEAQKGDRSSHEKKDVERSTGKQTDREGRSSDSEKPSTLLVILKTLHVIFCGTLLLISSAVIVLTSIGISLFKESFFGIILLLILGVFMFFFSVVGIVGGLRKSKDLGWVTAVGFALLIGIHVFLVIRSTNFSVSSFLTAQSSNWGSMDNTERSNFQNMLSCCGYYTQVDRPGVPCPVNNKGSCSSVLSDAAKQYTGYSQAIYALSASLEGLAIITGIIISYVM